MKNIYCTLDTETVGGASHPTGMYNLGGIIHDRKGNILATFSYLVANKFEEIRYDDYAKKNFPLYLEKIKSGEVTMVDTEESAVEAVRNLLRFYGVRYIMAYNSGFDFVKTPCSALLDEFEFIDIYLMAVQTISPLKKYANFCRENGLQSHSKKSVATSAESMYAFITGNASYQEEHTAFEDSKIEMAIFLRALATHKKFTKNCHMWDAPYGDKCFPRWAV